ncbi:MAG: ribonuclease HII [Treponema sp.]|nr:ribonuclease HII [Treponema sp.]
MIICGIDEAGRGPLAGPVCAAAVILKSNFPLHILNDSKKMTSAHRDNARHIICNEALAWGIGWASHTEIDSINILQASLLAMKRAFDCMLKKYSLPPDANITAIADGKFAPCLGIMCTAMIKADAKVPEVMAASILAKTERDNYMDEMAKLYPQYGYEKHKGYPTKAHRQAVIEYGPSPIQRISFKVKI